MKIVVISCVIIFPLFVSAQMENWYGSDLSTLGYKRNSINFYKNPVDYESTIDYSDSSTIQYKGGSTELAADIFTKNIYFHLDGSFVLDLGYVWVQNSILKKKSKDPWYKKDFGNYDQTILLPFRFGVGSTITPYVNMYGGVQWQYSLYRFTPKTVPYEALQLGGSQYGLGLHTAFSYKGFLVKHSFMYDWVGRAREFKGNVLTNEVSVYCGIAQLGVFMKFNQQVHTINEGEYSTSLHSFFHSDLSSSTRYYREQRMNRFTFSVGIYASGLFSGVTRGISKAASTTEMETKRQRDEERRRTIEYKEN